MTSGLSAMARSKVSSAFSTCRSSRTWMNTDTVNPSASASSRLTYRIINPASSSRRTRARHGDGDRFTARANSTLGSRASSWSRPRIFQSVASSSIALRCVFGILCFISKYLHYIMLIYHLKTRTYGTLFRANPRSIRVMRARLRAEEKHHDRFIRSLARFGRSLLARNARRSRSGGDARMAGCLQLAD